MVGFRLRIPTPRHDARTPAALMKSARLMLVEALNANVGLDLDDLANEVLARVRYLSTYSHILFLGGLISMFGNLYKKSHFVASKTIEIQDFFSLIFFVCRKIPRFISLFAAFVYFFHFPGKFIICTFLLIF